MNVPNAPTPHRRPCWRGLPTPDVSGQNIVEAICFLKNTKSSLLKMHEIRLRRLTQTIINAETNTCLVLICQSSGLHLEPQPELLSLGQLPSRQHRRRFLACSYTCGSILCWHRRWESPGVHKRGTDNYGALPPPGITGTASSTCQLLLYMLGCFPSGPCNCQSRWGRFREGHKTLTATGRAALLPSGCHQYKGRVWHESWCEGT